MTTSVLTRVPALPPITPEAATIIRDHVAAYLFDLRWAYAENAFCYAQALATSDGRRRRVTKQKTQWIVDLAP